MFTCKERVVRDGHLVAFAGEVMTDEEAAKRGLNKAAEPENVPTDPEDMTVPQLKAFLDSKGIEHPKSAKKAELLALLDPAEEEDEDLYDDEEEDE